MYDVTDYGAMMLDQPRMQAYQSALQRAVQPGSVVVDIGTGTGIFALLACRYGARKVYAFDPNNAIHVARRIAAKNGFSDRIDFIQDLSTRVTLPERADVIVSDLRGVMPLNKLHIESIIHARQNFLAEGGSLLPCRDTLWGALIDSPKVYRWHVGAYDGNIFGLDLGPARQFAVNAWRRACEGELLVQPQCWGTLDYRTIASPNLAGTLRWTMETAGTAHGLSLWFDAEVAEGLRFSNSPLKRDVSPYESYTVYGQAFVIFQEPLSLAPGETVVIRVRATQIVKDYVWQWNTDVFTADDPSERRLSYQQSTFFGVPLSAESLRKRTKSYRAGLSTEGEIASFVLESFDGQTSAGDLADRLIERFPNQFKERKSALDCIYELVAQFGK